MIKTRVGKLTVIAEADRTQGHTQFVCKCDCGTEKLVRGDHLRNAKIKSCGCLRRRTKRGYVAARKSEYWIWLGIKQRCTNPSATSFHKYGGRGISICDRWANSFDAFLEDMGPRPTPNHSVDRIDNSGNYEPGNCRWADIKTQARNTRYNRIIEFDGQRQCIAYWADQIGAKPNTLVTRLRSGWSVEKTLRTPIAPRRSRLKEFAT